VEVGGVVSGEIGEAALLLAPVEVVHPRDTLSALVDLRFVEDHEAVDIRQMHRFEENAVNDAEDGGVGADAEREHQDRDDRVAARGEQDADGVFDVLQERLHRCASGEEQNQKTKTKGKIKSARLKGEPAATEATATPRLRSARARLATRRREKSKFKICRLGAGAT